MRPINLLLAMLLGLASLSGEAAGLRFSLVKTAETKTLDAFTVEGGQWTQTAIANHVAVLIEHHAATLLLGSVAVSRRAALLRQMAPGKAQGAGNGRSLAKSCNTA